MDFQQPNQQQPNQQQINQQQPDQNIQPNPVVDQPPKNIRKIVVLIIIGVLILGSASYGAYYWWPKNNKPVACTQEAKQCPDGSYVSRTGPNCEFALCPSTTPDQTAGWQTYRNEEYGFEITFPKSWANYRSEQKDNSIIFSLKRQHPLIYNDGTKKEYGEILTIIIHPKTEWEQIKNQEPQFETVIKENNQYVATYILGQDDSGFIGYPEPIPNQIYKGPYYEVQNLILPTFKFIK